MELPIGYVVLTSVYKCYENPFQLLTSLQHNDHVKQHHKMSKTRVIRINL
jgi:hypothetical protein